MGCRFRPLPSTSVERKTDHSTVVQSIWEPVQISGSWWYLYLYSSISFSSSGRSGKTNGIVIEAKMRAGWRLTLFRQEIGLCKPNYAGVSVIQMTSAKRHLLTKKKSDDNKNLLKESADKKKICWWQKSADGICWQETSSYKICLRKERHLAMEKILK